MLFLRECANPFDFFDFRSSSSSANLVINGLTSSNSISNNNNNINNNNNNGSLHCPQLTLQAQDQAGASLKMSHQLPMSVSLENRDAKGGQALGNANVIMPSGSSGHASEIQLHQQQNHYNSSNNPLTMMGGMMQQQQQHQQQNQHQHHMSMQHQQHQMMQGQGQGFPQHGTSMMAASRQMPALAALSNLGDTAPIGSQLNSSLELDDNDLSPDEDDDDLEHDLDELEAAKQQLIDGGSSSSTSLQAPPSQHGSGSGGSGGQTPGSKKNKPSYNCLLCPKSYRKRKSLLDHYKMHPGFCHDCGQPNGNTLEVIHN